MKKPIEIGPAGIAGLQAWLESEGETDWIQEWLKASEDEDLQSQTEVDEDTETDTN